MAQTLIHSSDLSELRNGFTTDDSTINIVLVIIIIIIIIREYRKLRASLASTRPTLLTCRSLLIFHAACCLIFLCNFLASSLFLS